ncbi:MAG: DoxX family protein [Pirellulales bacterium]|nr:DoxX family protein [Pirellulales bacterium]
MRRVLSTSASWAVAIIRLMVGAVFLSEGLQKFLFPAEVGAGRFAKIGFEAPQLTANVVACCEIAGGLLVLLGLATRIAAVPLMAIMLTAIYTTKLPILQQQGFWKMAHEARTDWAMLWGSFYLFIVGAGAWSLDALLDRRGTSSTGRERLPGAH